jgi:methionine biosynthesis protein MetW
LASQATGRETALGPDHLFIVGAVPEGSRVLDLGCGTGDLLKVLSDHKGVKGTGIEIVEERVYEAAAKGVTVHHGDFSEVLSYYPDASFDYVVLSETLQQAHETLGVINEALRVGSYLVASFPNFGHWKPRLQLLFTGRVPVTEALPYQWYDTPNVRSLTIRDFRRFTREHGMQIVRSFYWGERRQVRLLPNLRAVNGLFIVEKTTSATKPGGVE